MYIKTRSHKIFDNYLVAIRKINFSLKFNKLVYIELCILEFSTVLMYDFHYGYIENKFANKLTLLFTDVDTLMCEIKTEDVYEDFNSDKQMFDFTNYSTESKYYDNANKFVIRKTKDESVAVANEEFIKLKTKMYLFSEEDNSEHKKSKGLNVMLLQQ